MRALLLIVVLIGCACSSGLTAGTQLIARPSADAPSPDSVRRLLGRATFVFDGTVLSRGSAIDPILGHRPSFATVRVHRTAVCPEDVGDLADEIITLDTDEDAGLVVGARRWFFAEGWVIGESIALRHIAAFRTAPPRTADPVLENLSRAIASDAGAHFRDEVRGAALAAVVTVTGTGISVEGEHDDRWIEVRATIDSVIPFPGRTDARGTSIIFLAPVADASSRGAQRALSIGAQGVALLHLIKEAPELQRADAASTYFAPRVPALYPHSALRWLRDAKPTPAFLHLLPVRWCTRRP